VRRRLARNRDTLYHPQSYQHPLLRTTAHGILTVLPRHKVSTRNHDTLRAVTVAPLASPKAVSGGYHAEAESDFYPPTLTLTLTLTKRTANLVRHCHGAFDKGGWASWDIREERKRKFPWRGGLWSCSA
jgi:hypothetical protein